jgi:WD40 repeat protein
MRNRKEVIRVKHDLPVWSVRFSLDGKHLITASEDRTARVWDVDGGQEVMRIYHDGPVKGLAFGAGDGLLATASADNHIAFAVWKRADVIAEACTRLTRNLTREEWRRYIPNDPYRKTCPSLPGS